MQNSSQKQEVTFWLLDVVDRNVLGHVLVLTQIKEGDQEESRHAAHMEQVKKEITKEVKHVLISSEYTSHQVRDLVNDAINERKYVHDLVVISATEALIATLSHELRNNSAVVSMDGLGRHYNSEEELFVSSVPQRSSGKR